MSPKIAYTTKDLPGNRPTSVSPGKLRICILPTLWKTIDFYVTDNLYFDFSFS
jgi:hypothetical protein